MSVDVEGALLLVVQGHLALEIPSEHAPVLGLDRLELPPALRAGERAQLQGLGTDATVHDSEIALEEEPVGAARTALVVCEVGGSAILLGVGEGALVLEVLRRRRRALVRVSSSHVFRGYPVRCSASLAGQAPPRAARPVIPRGLPAGRAPVRRRGGGPADLGSARPSPRAGEHRIRPGDSRGREHRARPRDSSSRLHGASPSGKADRRTGGREPASRVASRGPPE